MNRYAVIDRKLPRELVLLQGRGCAWKGCSFCDYHHDVSDDPYAVNRPALERVSGRFGVLDVINSGSCVELDAQTLDAVAALTRERSIHTLWFEAHWMYRHDLAGFAARFPQAAVKFRVGVETFDDALRARWNKGMPASCPPEEVARYFQGVCLLVGVEGQTREGISRDIALADAHFAYYSVNAFVENTTAHKRDAALVGWLEREWGPRLAQNPRAELLLHNTDLGVG